jgi:hypothetical protein
LLIDGGSRWFGRFRQYRDFLRRQIKIAALLLVATQGHAAEVRCPDQWAPAGWVAHGSTSGARIRDAGLMVGPLENHGDLRGDERKTQEGYEVRFTRLNDYVEPLPKWAYCSYGADARLLKRLPDATTECLARVRAKAATVQCK